MIFRASTLSLLAAAALCASALGAVSGRNPRQLVLQPSDVPSGAARLPLSGLKGTVSVPTGGSVRPYGVGYRFRRGSRREVVGSVVFVFSSEGAAKAALARTLRGTPKTYTTFSVPRLGDKQWTAGYFHRQASAAVIVVRSDEVIWEIAVSDAPGLTRAQAIAEALKYARKQRARVD
jgi:hypothetical protein